MGVLPRRAHIAQLQPAMDIDLACVLPNVHTLVAIFIVPIAEEYLKQYLVFAVFIIVYETYFFSYFNGAFHLMTHFAPFWFRVVLHSTWNALVIARESGLLTFQGAAVDPLTTLSQRKNRKMINSKYFKKHQNAHASNRPGESKSAEKQRLYKENRGAHASNRLGESKTAEKQRLYKEGDRVQPTPEALVRQAARDKKVHTQLVEARAAAKGTAHTKNPALAVAALTGLLSSIPTKKAEVKNIVNAKPVDLKAGEHDTTNFPHAVSIMAGGVPVAYAGDMSSTQVMAAADKKMIKHDGQNGVAVTMRCRMPVSTFYGNAATGDTSTQSFKANPADTTAFPLIAPAARIFDCWNFNHIRLYTRTETSTTVPNASGVSGNSRIVLSADPEVTDLPPITKNAAESQTIAKAIAAWENAELTIPSTYFRRTKYYYMDDGVLADADERVTTPFQWFITVADNSSGVATPLGEIWVEAEFEFWSSTLSSLGFLPPPSKFVVGTGTSQLDLLTRLYSSLDDSLHNSIPGASSAVPGSNPNVAIVASATASTTAIARFRVLLPFLGTAQTGGRAVPGSYLISVAATSLGFTLNDAINFTAQNAAVLHNQPALNGFSGNEGWSGIANVATTQNAAFARFDVPVTAGRFNYTTATDSFTNYQSHWGLAPSVQITINGTANAQTSIVVYVVSLSTVAPALLSTTAYNDTKTVTRFDQTTIPAFDGAITHRVKSVVAAPLPPMSNVITVDNGLPACQPQRDTVGGTRVLAPSSAVTRTNDIPLNPPSPTPSVIGAAVSHALTSYFGSAVRDEKTPK
jgi:hypothetical protein